MARRERVARDAGGATYGTVFKVTPSGDYTLLHSFRGTDGQAPLAPLMQAADGYFYGTTSGCNHPIFETVFRIDAAGNHTVLHRFNVTDGCDPEAGLLQASDGNFYGTTAAGGAHGYGTVFKMTPAGVVTVVYSFRPNPRFQPTSDGLQPRASLIQAADGSFYGTTSAGGSHNKGVVFRLDLGLPPPGSPPPPPPPTTTQFTVTPEVMGNGSISPNTPQVVAVGSTIGFTLLPAAGHLIGTVGGTCGGTLSGTTFTTAPVTQSCTVQASFVPQPVITATDSDGDGLPNEWEILFGLEPLSGVGHDGPAGDPDADGSVNLEEFELGTHPRGFFTRYLAEGATGDFWHMRVALANPNGTKALTLVRFLRANGGPINRTLEVPAMGRRTVDPEGDPALANQAISAVVESDVQLVVRTMWWDARAFGSHAETSVEAPAATWYLAEGHTQPFHLFYLIQNPNRSPITVEVRYLRPAPAPPLVRTYDVAALSRFTIYVNWIAELEGTAVSAVLRALDGRGIIVERAMYLGAGSRAGHASAGVTAPAPRWFLAEGATGFFFDFFILLANPTDTDTVVDARFLRHDGVVVETSQPVPAQSRANIYVNDLHPLLADAAVSTILTSRNDVPIIVERAMYWDRRGLHYEAHNSPGATVTGTKWGLADGEAGAGTDTYILVANTSPFPGRIRLTLLFEDGETAEQELDLLPNSRLTMYAPQHFPQANGRRFGAVIESLGDDPAQIVVERAMYSSVGGVFWEAGTNVLGTRLP